MLLEDFSLPQKTNQTAPSTSKKECRKSKKTTHRKKKAAAMERAIQTAIQHFKFQSKNRSSSSSDDWPWTASSESDSEPISKPRNKLSRFS
ncbi:ORF3 [Torque teno indri virus 1]|uniref:ORF3 n=1 Tax=Torque teno indri virus 1 TaxID=2010248 RepID=A0A1Z1W0T3_9VIRU|nr:ORF3 [Torque teno indri virus 1]ARX79664.1 ORF3 [Torque teno indri virus 1]